MMKIYYKNLVNYKLQIINYKLHIKDNNRYFKCASLFNEKISKYNL